MEKQGRRPEGVGSGRDVERLVINTAVDLPVRRKPNRWWLVLTAVAAMLLIGLVVLFVFSRATPTVPDVAGAVGRDAAETETEAEAALAVGRERQGSGGGQPRVASRQAVPASAAGEHRVADDGQLLWASPTSGPPLSLSYLVSGAQVFVGLRPAAILQHPEGEKVIDALGPVGAELRDRLRQLTGVPLGDIESLVVGIGAGLEGELIVSLVVRLREPMPERAAASDWAWEEPKEHGGQQYYTSSGWAYYLPPAEGNRTVAIAREADVVEVMEAGDAGPPLRREMERMLALSDAERHLTVLFSPSFLQSDGQQVLSGTAVPLRKGIAWLVGDGVRAAMASVHLGDEFFAELRVGHSAEVRTREWIGQIEARMRELPERVESHIVSLDAHPYGRRVVARLPRMVQLLTHYTRVGEDRGHAVVRSYLPVVAAHNLVMGVELVLNLQPGAGLK